MQHKSQKVRVFSDDDEDIYVYEVMRNEKQQYVQRQTLEYRFNGWSIGTS